VYVGTKTASAITGTAYDTMLYVSKHQKHYVGPGTPFLVGPKIPSYCRSKNSLLLSVQKRSPKITASLNMYLTLP